MHTNFNHFLNRTSNNNLFATLFLLYLLVGCGEQKEPETIEEQNDPILELESEIQALAYIHKALHEIEAITLNQLFVLVGNDPNGVPRPDSHLVDANDFLGIGSCGGFILDSDENVLILDYGMGCTDPYDKFRAGQIKIEYESALNPIGNQVRISIEGLNTEDFTLSGILQMQKLSENNSQYTDGYQIEFSDLIIQIEEYTLEMSGKREFLYTHNIDGQGGTADNSSSLMVFNSIEGSINELDFEFENTSELVYTAPCWLGGNLFPHLGNTSLTISAETFEIKFNGCGYDLKVVDEQDISYILKLKD